MIGAIFYGIGLVIGIVVGIGLLVFLMGCLVDVKE